MTRAGLTVEPHLPRHLESRCLWRHADKPDRHGSSFDVLLSMRVRSTNILLHHTTRQTNLVEIRGSCAQSSEDDIKDEDREHPTRKTCRPPRPAAADQVFLSTYRVVNSGSLGNPKIKSRQWGLGPCLLFRCVCARYLGEMQTDASSGCPDAVRFKGPEIPIRL